METDSKDCCVNAKAISAERKAKVRKARGTRAAGDGGGSGGAGGGGKKKGAPKVKRGYPKQQPAAWVAAAARKGGDTSGFKTWAGRLTDVTGDTGGCLLLRATVGADVASNSEKKYAKKCADQAIVSAWTAAVGG